MSCGAGKAEDVMNLRSTKKRHKTLTIPRFLKGFVRAGGPTQGLG
jgi:hypothetical protein